MVFNGCSGVGHWNSIDIERARGFLEKRDMRAWLGADGFTEMMSKLTV